MTSRPLFPFSKLVLTGLALLCAAIALPAAASCNIGGCKIGPCISDNLLVDHDFESPSCSAWSGNGYLRLTDADTCSSPYFNNLMMKLKGADGQGVVRSFYQDIPVPNTGTGQASVGFNVDIQGANAGYWDRLRVSIRDTNNNILEYVTYVLGTYVSTDCDYVEVSVNGDYRGQTIRLYFEATIWTGDDTAFVIDNVYFWHSYF